MSDVGEGMNNLPTPLILGCRRNATFGLVYVVKYDDGDEEARFTNPKP